MIAVLDRLGRTVPDDQVLTPPSAGSGVLPACLFVTALGVLLVALADNAGRHGEASDWWIAVYWVGEVIVFTPAVLMLASRRKLADGDAVGLVLSVAGATYLVKYLYSPLAFGFPDELAHWRTATTLLDTQHLFNWNYGLPVSPLYPGLEEATGAVVAMTGLSVFVAGMIVAGLAHLVFAAALYLVFRRAGGTAWLAVAAATLYAMSPHYQVFDAIFGYQTLALAFFGLALLAVGRLAGRAGDLRWWLVTVALVIATVATHHVTSYVLAATLLLVAVVAGVRWLRSRDPGLRVEAHRYFVLALATTGLIIAWIAFVAPLTVGYLTPTASNFLGGIRSALAARTSGQNAVPAGPFVDEIGNYAAALLIMVALPLGWRHIWRTQRKRPWAPALAIGSVGYYLVVLLRVTTPDGAEIAGRALTFLYVPIGFVLAHALLGLPELRLPAVHRFVTARLAPWLTVIAALILLFGGLSAGWPPYWERLPGGFVVDGFESGITPEGLATTDWVTDTLGSDHRLAADFTNNTLLSGYGDEDVADDVDALYCGARWTDGDARLTRDQGIQYVVVDLRMSRQKPASGTYFSDQSTACPEPIPLADLLKFDSVPGASRIYDSGDILIYDLRAVSDAP